MASDIKIGQRTVGETAEARAPCVGGREPGHGLEIGEQVEGPRSDCRFDTAPLGEKARRRVWAVAHRTRTRPREKVRAVASRNVVKISSKFCSFSAVSAPIFATKYAFCSIFQNLPDYLAENFEIWQILQILRHLQNVC